MDTRDIIAVFNRPSGNPSARAYLFSDGLDAYKTLGDDVDSSAYNFIMGGKEPFDDERVKNAFVHFVYTYGLYIPDAEKIPLDSFFHSKIDDDPETIEGAKKILDWTYRYIVATMHGEGNKKVMKLFGFTDIFGGNKIRKYVNAIRPEDLQVHSWTVEDCNVSKDVDIQIHGGGKNLSGVPDIVKEEFEYRFRCKDNIEFLFKPPKLADLNPKVFRKY